MRKVCFIPTVTLSFSLCVFSCFRPFVSMCESHLYHCCCLHMCCTCLLVFISYVHFPQCDSPTLCLCLSVSVHVRVGSHVVDLGLKLWVITPIMNHHALFRLPSPSGIDCIMKLSFSLSNTLCPHITHLTNIAVHTKSDVALNETV